MVDRLWAVSLLFFNSESSTQGTKTEINKFMSSQENIYSIASILNHSLKSNYVNTFEFQNESTYRKSLSVNLRLLVPKLFFDTVIKFH